MIIIITIIIKNLWIKLVHCKPMFVTKVTISLLRPYTCIKEDGFDEYQLKIKNVVVQIARYIWSNCKNICSTHWPMISGSALVEIAPIATKFSWPGLTTKPCIKMKMMMTMMFMVMTIMTFTMIIIIIMLMK